MLQQSFVPRGSGGAALVERLEVCGIAYVDRAARLQYLWSAIIAYGV